MRFAVLLSLILFAAADGVAVTGCAAASAGPPATGPAAPRPAGDAPSAAAAYGEYPYHPARGSITIQAGVVRGAKRVAAFEKRAHDLPQRDVFPMVEPPAAAATKDAPAKNPSRASSNRRRGGGTGGAAEGGAGRSDPAKGNLAEPADGKRQVFRRRETVDGRRIDTVVVLDPPAEPSPKSNGKDPAHIPGENGDESDAPTDFWIARVLVRVDGRLKVAVTLGTSGEGDGELYIPRVTLYPEDATLDILALSGEGEELNLPADWLGLDDRTLITDGSFFEDDPSPPGGGPYEL